MPRRGRGHAVNQSPVVQREFSTQSMLAGLDSIDFVHRQIEFKGQAVGRLTWVPRQLELGVGVRSCPDVELGIKVVAAVRRSDPAETVRPPHPIAVSPVVQRGSGVHQVTQDERLIGLVLEAHADVDESQTARHAGAKVSDRRGKIGGFIAERLAAAERALGSARNRHRSLTLGCGLNLRRRNLKRTEHQHRRRYAKNPKTRRNGIHVITLHFALRKSGAKTVIKPWNFLGGLRTVLRTGRPPTEAS